jgi:Adenylate and Guanylate cyclase catalytic domain
MILFIFQFRTYSHLLLAAARMESTGVRDKIHVSQQTADLLIAAGKTHWVTPRQDQVNVKGKGLMTTFFLSPFGSKQANNGSNSGGSEIGSCSEFTKRKERSGKRDRLVDWAVDMMSDSVRKMVRFEGFVQPVRVNVCLSHLNFVAFR